MQVWTRLVETNPLNLQRGNIVFFNAEDLISESESVKFTGHAAWRDKQILGVVLAVPNVRHGAFGTAHRRISGNEMMYRVKVIRYVTAEYAKFPDALELRGIGGGIPAGGGGVRVLSSSVEGAVGPDGEGKKAMLTEEKQRAWKLDKQIDMLEQEKIEAQKEHGSSEGSDTVDKDEDNFAQVSKRSGERSEPHQTKLFLTRGFGAVAQPLASGTTWGNNPRSPTEELRYPRWGAKNGISIRWPKLACH